VLIRPRAADFRLVGLLLARVVTGTGVLMLAPALVALLRAEWNALSALLVGAFLAITVGSIVEARSRTRRTPTWGQGMVTVGFAWLVAPLFGAVPVYLSGHVGGFLDAYIEAVSGFTTTGLSLVQDLDHLAVSINLWRHVMHLAGGQAIIIVVLTLFTAANAQGSSLYLGANREGRLLPNFARTTRFTLTVAAMFAVLGSLALAAATAAAGLSPSRALLHGVALFASAYDTGGFSLQSTSVGYYHSLGVEAVLIVLMFAGALSYGLHYQLWRGNRGELRRNIEMRTFAVTFLGLLGVILAGLGRSGAFTDAAPMFRRGFFAMAAAHTTTGLRTGDTRVIVADWGLLAPAALVAAMAIGGMASSTSGGIKAIRIGVTLKGVSREVRRVLLPESALVVSTYHQHRRHVLRDGQVRAAATVLLLFLFTYLAGGVVALFTDPSLDFTEALLESTSAASNTGLSLGILTPAAAPALKVVFALQMWLGRLEFMAAFAAVGYVIAIVRGRS
jgi:trk system potassium uptake protein TrkH